MRGFKRFLPFFGMCLLLPALASGVTRDKAMQHAAEYSDYIWTSSNANKTASCAPGYSSLFLDIYGVGGPHKGLAYDWGGWDVNGTFQQKINDGYGAGSHSSDGILSCTTGQDCSGFVSRCWETSNKYATATLHQITNQLSSTAALKRGDAVNKAGSHVVLFDKLAGNGNPLFYESAGGSVRKSWYNAGASWSYLSGYKPVRYNQIEEGVAGPPQPGSPEVPIVVNSFPYTDSRSTVTDGKSNFDVYNCAPDKGELGPEVIYQLNFASSGQMTAVVDCGPGVDIDLHLLTAIDKNACVDRAHITLGPIAVNEGVYYLAADSWSNSSGTAYPGPYTLTIHFVANPAPVPPAVNPLSCAGICGDAASGGCGCGPDCLVAGDCCGDACQECGTCAAPAQPPAEEPAEVPAEEEVPTENISTPLEQSGESEPSPEPEAGDSDSGETPEGWSIEVGSPKTPVSGFGASEPAGIPAVEEPTLLRAAGGEGGCRHAASPVQGILLFALLGILGGLGRFAGFSARF